MELKVRDRSAEFAERRATVCTRCDRSESSVPEKPTEQLFTAPLWSRLPSDFEENALALSHQIDQLRSRHLLFLKPKLRSKDEEDELRALIDKQAVDIRAFLKMLEHTIVLGTQLKSTYSEEEARIVKSVQARLTARFKELALQFKSAQELFGAELHRREQKSSKYMKVGSDAAYEAVQQEERTVQFLEMGFTEQDAQSILIEDMQRDQTNKEIKDILDSIQEIHCMFEDLHTLVVDQGTMLDRIDYNVDKALVSASKAQIELERARENQSSCILM
ncbi:putative QA-SNARE protein [Leishmania major strain Friedlin]|uniref:Putative QA-SNARE protein n=1 Tax=Leishmania major TaxID=5664 RepID=Q4Q454_LEIMA|nr:putative QA-SNARE protein [Leishmania major strain Friedlin]CAG9580711.1 QA-SNARE_protein_putative [Leishmania major strain Friedlin]CAJ06328.1 putative QA-SNARE protein [Leishmania major strain Friedlin]|eukprot:XP_001685894.1 putative QA-SNARE protein [Leishmania major strain Friedlin]